MTPRTLHWSFEEEEDDEVEEEEELEMFDESIDPFEQSSWRHPALLPPFHGGTLRRRVGLHDRAQRTRAPSRLLFVSRSWTRQFAADHG